LGGEDLAKNSRMGKEKEREEGKKLVQGSMADA